MAEKTRAGALPAGIVVGSRSVWVSNSGQAKVWGYAPDAFQEIRSYPDPSVGKRPTGIAAGEANLGGENSAGDSGSGQSTRTTIR